MSIPTAEASSASPSSSREEAFVRLLCRKNLAVGLAIVAVCLASPSLFTGFYLDDQVGRYIYSDLPGAHELHRLYQGGYGIADGNPATTHWQIERGFAPWWTYDRLLLSFFRPIGVASHYDFHLWPNNAFLMHAHNIAWLAVLVLVMTRMYRSVLGDLVGGLAALLFALDHTHGFVVGYICNRHALLAGAFGATCLYLAFEAKKRGSRGLRSIGPPIVYVVALLSSESAIAVLGYLLAYALFVEEGTPKRRLLSFAPYLGITLVWRALYNHGGYGGRGSGLYIDPARDPLHFLAALLERGPILVLGQFFHPPSELYVLLPERWAHVHYAFASAFVLGLCVALVPLLKKDRVARFWTLGMVIALVPAASTYPHNRQLLFPSFGAMGLIAQLWHLYAVEWKGRVLTRASRFAGGFGAVVLFNHMILSPIYAPVAACSILFTRPLMRAAAKVGDDIVGHDAVFMTAPDYFAVKLVQLGRRIDRKPLPRRWRALSFGPQPVTVTRVDARTLSLDYEGGILGTPFMELYRDKRLRMTPGETVSLEGLDIEVSGVTEDGRANRAEFKFDTPLDDPMFVFYYWTDNEFRHFTPPPVGGKAELPSAEVDWTDF